MKNNLKILTSGSIITGIIILMLIITSLILKGFLFLIDNYLFLTLSALFLFCSFVIGYWWNLEEENGGK